MVSPSSQGALTTEHFLMHVFHVLVSMIEVLMRRETYKTRGKRKKGKGSKGLRKPVSYQRLIPLLGQAQGDCESSHGDRARSLIVHF